MNHSHPSAFVKKPTAIRLFRTAAFASITAAAMLSAPSSTNAQNSHKPTAKHFKQPVDDTAPAQVEAGVQPSNEAPQPTSGPAISPFVITAPVGPAWTALGPAPIPNGSSLIQRTRRGTRSWSAVASRTSRATVTLAPVFTK